MSEDRWHEMTDLKRRAQELKPSARANAASRRGRRSRRKRSRSRDLSAEEQAYREARRRAERKVRFARDLVGYVCVVGVLLLTLRTVGVVVGVIWGIGLATRAFSQLAAPSLRRRWIEDEVGRQVHKSVTRERESQEGQRVRSLEELSASIAHEIRNPITAAKSLVQQLGEDPGGPDNVEYARVALEELDRVERSISHLLRYAREEDLQLREIRMGEVVDGALESLRERVSAVGVRVVKEVDGDGEMEGDPEKLRRILINLIGNAIDLLDESGFPDPEVRIQVGVSLSGGEVWIRVRDNGPGMDPESLEKIFRPFYSKKVGGTGLGLAICKKLVDAHHGTLEVKSELGNGAEFLITLPRWGEGDS